MAERTDKLIKGLMITFLAFVVVDMGLTYYAVRYLGINEGSLIIGKAGLIPGIGVVAILFFFIGWLLWKMRGSRMGRIISISGLSLLCVIEVITLATNFILL